jgi:hypothetical protein
MAKRILTRKELIIIRKRLDRNLKIVAEDLALLYRDYYSISEYIGVEPLRMRSGLLRAGNETHGLRSFVNMYLK